MKDFLTFHNRLGETKVSGSSFTSSRSGSSRSSSSSSGSSGSSGSSVRSSSSSSTTKDKMTTPPGAVGFHSSSGENWTVYYDASGNKYNSIEEYQAEMKRQEEERKRKEEAAANGHNHGQHDRGGNRTNGDNGMTEGGDYSFSLDDEIVRNKINSEDDNTLLYVALGALVLVGGAFLLKNNKKKNNSKKK